QGQSNKSTSYKYNPTEDDVGTGFPIEPPRVKNGFSHSNSVIHPRAVKYSWSNKQIQEDDSCHSVSSRMMGPSSRTRGLKEAVGTTASNNDSGGYAPKRNRILFSGPLMPPGGNMEDMLKEHERQIQEAVRKARADKNRT
ncbi:hypothetical protein M569_16962, partial [Genlisea aurea]